jgi:hypothetical protein
LEDSKTVKIFQEEVVEVADHPEVDINVVTHLLYLKPRRQQR